MAVSYESVFIDDDLLLAISNKKPELLSVGYSGFISNGRGSLSGAHPDGIVTDDWIPVSAEIIIRIRSKLASLDGLFVAKTKSGVDGTWLIPNLNPLLKYDVIARLDGRNDVIGSDLTPKV